MLGQIEGLPQINLDSLLVQSGMNESIGVTKTLVAVTNGESVSEIFPQWTRRAYLGPKCYRPYDLNMPLIIPGRSRLALKLDSPLTEFGKVCSSIVARDLLRSNIFPSHIFCSPELRNVETARCIANKMFEESKLNIPILVEPSLVEWRNFDEAETEKYWLTNEQFNQLGYSVDNDHNPFLLIKYLPTSETPQQYFDRLVEFLQHVEKNYEGSSILVASSALTCLLNSQGWKNGQELHKVRSATPCCSVAIKCVPSCEHEESSAHGKLQPFTRTLYEARKNRAKK